MLRPPVLAACLVLGLAGRARAGGPVVAQAGTAKTSKVTIETDPPGAKVYFNLKEDGEVCTTPCTVDAPIGETPIIVEAENRRSLIENLVVPRKTAKPLRVSYKLRPALGSLVIAGGDGAAILIDERSQGTAPRRFDDIAAGAHHVVIEKNGVKLYDAFVEIETDGEATVSPPAQAAAPEAAGAPPAVAAEREPPGRAPPRQAPMLAVSAAADIGFRQFTFHYPNAGAAATARNDRESGQVMTGAIVELWPTTLFGLGLLPGLELYGRFEIGVNPQRVTIKPSAGPEVATSLSTSWRSLEISLRHRWTSPSIGTVEVGAGYIDDRFQFTTDDLSMGPADLERVPDVSYKAVRIGGRASLLLGAIEPYLAAENRLVLSGGALPSRYKLGSSANGVQIALGAAVHLGRFEIRAEGRLTSYSWTFGPDRGDPDQADSGSDVIEQIGLTLGYVY
ncbi:MAG TPA: PEGA domain-containing protein [Kofleriaceae bacterium]|nr:PEGA domain-containing protein [Kofleriaceae bacterium]